MGSNNKINICFVTREYAHPKMGKTGGIGVFTRNHCLSLSKDNFRIFVFTFGTERILMEDEGIIILRIRDLTGFNERIKDLAKRVNLPGYISLKIILEFFNRLYRSLLLSVFLKRNKIDLLEFHDYGGDAPYFYSRVPYLIRCHGSAWSLHRHLGYIRRKTDDIFEKVLFRKKNSINVLAVSHYCAEITKNCFNLERLPDVIYNGIAIRIDDCADEPYMTKDILPLSVYYVGAIRERKGIDIACDVFNSIQEQFPDSSFHVLGHNNNDHWNKVSYPLLSPEARKRTKYYGFIPNELVPGHLKKAHVVIFPSFGENFSIALLEAMALKKIVLVSDIPSFREIIKHGENGFICDSKEQYVDFIISIFKGELDLDIISDKAYETITQKFNQDDLIKQNIDYYLSIIK